MFWNGLEHFGSRTALITEDGRYISYQELVEQADEIGSAVEGRCLVFVLCSNCVDVIAGYIGFLRHRVVPLMLGKGIDQALLDNLLETYHPAYVLYPKEEERYFQGETVWGSQAYVLIRLPYEQDYELADDLCALMTTSGSTGSLKLVRQSGRNIEAHANLFAKSLCITPEDRVITTLPIQYSYGLAIVQSQLFCGGSVIVTGRTMLDREFWTLLNEQGASTFSGVPYNYEMLKRLNFREMDLPSLRYITEGGGKLPENLVREFSELCGRQGIKFFVLYGQTEAIAAISYLPWEYAEEKSGSIGIAGPGGQLLLCDEKGQEITEADTPGELVFCGQSVTLGYAENRFDLNKPDENHGMLHTGDIAIRDKDGFFYIVGRKKRFLKLFGSRVSLDEVEGLLHQQGISCACTGVDDHMEIYVTERKNLAAAAAAVRKLTAIRPSAFSVRYIEKIPRNDAGKVLYSELGRNP